MWDFINADFGIFRAKLNDANWEDCYDDDIDTMVDKWTKKFLQIAQSTILNKTMHQVK